MYAQEPIYMERKHQKHTHTRTVSKGCPSVNEADRRLRAEFSLRATTCVLLPSRNSLGIPPNERFNLTLRNLTEAQARILLRAAKDAGIDFL